MDIKPITVVTIDDHALIREAVRSLLGSREDIAVVGEGSAGEDVLPVVEKHDPDVLLIDLRMPQRADNSTDNRFSILPTLAILSEKHQHTNIIVLSQYAPHALVQEVVRHGVKGYLLKGDDLSLNLVEAIRTVQKGGVFFSQDVGRILLQTPPPVFDDTLTERQREILLAKAKAPDASYAELAKRFHITESTLKGHLASAFKMLGVTNVTAAIIYCMQLHLIPFSFDVDGRLEFGDL